MQTTINYGFKKIELTDSPPDITVGQSNWDEVDKHLFNTAKFQKATGTATAITLTGVTLTDGFIIQFIASADNNGSVTTINGKSLYKEGTDVPPKLKKDKAVTAWYDSTKNCFFVKASAIGTAVAANVLAGKTFSNDDDIEIPGTMPDNEAVIITPSPSNKEIPLGYHNGSGYVAGDADLISANIKSGVNIFGVAGKSSVVDTADANAVAGAILTGQSAYVNGFKVNGAMVNNGAPVIIPSTTRQYLSGFYNGNGYVQEDPDLIPANIVSGKNIFGVLGTAIVGKRFATGSVFGGANYDNFITSAGNSIQVGYIAVSGLTFTPSMIFAYCDYNSGIDYTPVVFYKQNLSVSNTENVDIFAGSLYPSSANNSVYAFTFKSLSPAYVSASGFKLPVFDGQNYIRNYGGTFTWFAWE